MKRWFSLLLAALLLFSCAPAAFAADPPTATEEVFVAPEPQFAPPEPGERLRLRNTSADGDWEYYPDEGGVAVWAYHGSATEVTVPATLGGKPVVSIKQTFSQNTSIVSVSLPDSVTALGNSAFYGCTALQSVTIPGGSLTSLGQAAFYNCAALAEIPALGEGLAEIPQGAFSGCAALTQMELPTTVTAIGAYAFDHCTALASVTGGAVTSVGQTAFQLCTSLEAAPAFQSGMTEIPAYAFFDCRSLTQVTIPATVTSIGECAFWCNESSALTELDVPDSVTEIGSYAFTHSTTLIVGADSYAQQYCAENNYNNRLRGGVDLSVVIAPDAATVEDKAAAIVDALVTEGMSDYEQALILHDYLILHAQYDETLAGHKAEDVLLYGTGVCEAYTYAYKALLDCAKIPNNTETGTNHIWNMVQLDGEWVHVDCTWDDPLPDGQENHSFFGVTNYALQDVDSHECYWQTHIATDVTHSYAWVTGVLPTRIRMLEDELAACIEAGQFVGEITDPFLGEAQAATRASGGSDQHGVTNRMIFQGLLQGKGTAASGGGNGGGNGGNGGGNGGDGGGNGGNGGGNGGDAPGNGGSGFFNGLSWSSHPVRVKLVFDAAKKSQGQPPLRFGGVLVGDLDIINLPEDTVTLGDESLVGTVADVYVLHRSLTDFGESIFPTNHPFVLEVPWNSAALAYALEHGYLWQIGEWDAWWESNWWSDDCWLS